MQKNGSENMDSFKLEHPHESRLRQEQWRLHRAWGAAWVGSGTSFTKQGVNGKKLWKPESIFMYLVVKN